MDHAYAFASVARVVRGALRADCAGDAACCSGSRCQRPYGISSLGSCCTDIGGACVEAADCCSDLPPPDDTKNTVTCEAGTCQWTYVDKTCGAKGVQCIWNDTCCSG